MQTSFFMGTGNWLNIFFAEVPFLSLKMGCATCALSRITCAHIQTRILGAHSQALAQAQLELSPVKLSALGLSKVFSEGNL